MPGNLLAPKLGPAVTVTAAAATSSTAAFSLGGLGDSYQLILNISAATGTSPTLDAVLQTTFDGTNYVDLPLRYTQKTAAGIAFLVFKLGLGMNEVALEQAVADTGGTLAKNCLFDPFHMKVKYTIGGTNPSFTFTLTPCILPKGANAQY
jgi:hypothetical protein